MRFAATAFIVFLLAPVPSLFGGSILSTSCWVGSAGGTGVGVNSTEQCHINTSPESPQGHSAAWAMASTSYGLVPPEFHLPEGTYSFYASARTIAIFGGNNPSYPFLDGYSLASAYAELNVPAISAGPVRPGLVELFSFGDSFSKGHTTSYGQGRIGDLFVDGRSEGDCGGPCTVTFPFVLGQPFDIQAIAFALGWTADPYQLPPDADQAPQNDAVSDTHFRLRFRLTELDGTPVYPTLNPEPAPVPEPSTLLLLATAFSLLLLVRAIGRYRRA